MRISRVALSRFVMFIGLVLFLTFGSTFPASAADWKQALEEGLKAEYPLTQVGISALRFNYNRITAPGGVFVVRIPGVYADMAATKQAIVKTNIIDGRAVQQKGFLASLANTSAAKSLKPGESVYILREKVKDDGIEFELLTVDTVDHEGEQTRYRSVVAIPLSREALPAMTIEDLKKAINPVFATADVANATESKTIQLGMSKDEVKKALGNPDKIVDLGTKQLFIYKDMKVVFIDSKVTDVQ